MTADAKATTPHRPGPATALVLAAGEGRRMGGPKALLDLKGSTALERIARACREAGLPVLVVTGAHRGPVEAEAARLGLPTVHNPDWIRGRSGSVQAGWRAAGTTDALVWPVDVPFPGPATVRSLLGAADAEWAVVPSHGGRRGHPVLLPVCLRDRVLALGPDQPLHDVVRPAAREVPVDDDGILVDLNTPEEHRAALRREGGG